MAQSWPFLVYLDSSSSGKMSFGLRAVLRMILSTVSPLKPSRGRKPLCMGIATDAVVLNFKMATQVKGVDALRASVHCGRPP